MTKTKVSHIIALLVGLIMLIAVAIWAWHNLPIVRG